MPVDRRTLLQAAAALAIGKLALDARPALATGAGTGDFAFLADEWRIANRIKQGESWITFSGEASVHALLGGNASVEELRIAAAILAGSASTTARRFWNEHLHRRRHTDQGAGIWDRITPSSCRWRQGVSRDAGATWEDTWLMDWTRVG